jgi:hypothetical protein
MAEEDLGPSRYQWLWFLVAAGLAILLILWLTNSWQVESDVKPGASADGLTYPANPGIAVEGNSGGAGAPADAAPAEAAPADAAPAEAAPAEAPAKQ